MMNNRKQKLIGLGSETLAEAFLSLSRFSREADDLIEQLTATPKENEQRFKRKLSSLQHSGRFIDYQESYRFSLELQMLLKDLQAGVDDPLTGMKLVVAFYEADEAILGMCKNSTGSISAVFRYDAKELFTGYASLCSDKQEVADIILKLSQASNYGLIPK